MPNTPKRIAERLQNEGEKTVSFFEEIPPESWDQQVYSEGENWRVRDLLTHLVQSERGVSRLVTNIVKGGVGVPEDFDLDRYNQRKVKEIQGHSTVDLIRLFAEYRAQTVDMASQLGGEDLGKGGRHPFLGIAEVGDMLKLMYRHTQLHQRDIRRLLQ